MSVFPSSEASSVMGEVVSDTIQFPNIIDGPKPGIVNNDSEVNLDNLPLPSILTRRPSTEYFAGAKPLWVASMLNDLATVELCIADGADVSVADFNKRTPLWIACYKGNIDIVRCLIRNGCELGGGDVWEDRSPLYIAASQGYIDIMILLLDAHADVNRPNRDGVTPLIIGCYHGNKEVVSLLLQRNANPLHMDKSGNTARTICDKYGYKALSLECSVAERRYTKTSSAGGKQRRLSTVVKASLLATARVAKRNVSASGDNSRSSSRSNSISAVEEEDEDDSISIRDSALIMSRKPGMVRSSSKSHL